MTVLKIERAGAKVGHNAAIFPRFSPRSIRSIAKPLATPETKYTCVFIFSRNNPIPQHQKSVEILWGSWGNTRNINNFDLAYSRSTWASSLWSRFTWSYVRVLISATTNYRGSLFLWEFIFAILNKFTKFTKIRSGKIFQNWKLCGIFYKNSLILKMTYSLVHLCNIVTYLRSLSGKKDDSNGRYRAIEQLVKIRESKFSRKFWKFKSQK